MAVINPHHAGYGYGQCRKQYIALHYTYMGEDRVILHETGYVLSGVYLTVTILRQYALYWMRIYLFIYFCLKIVYVLSHLRAVIKLYRRIRLRAIHFGLHNFYIQIPFWLEPTDDVITSCRQEEDMVRPMYEILTSWVVLRNWPRNNGYVIMVALWPVAIICSGRSFTAARHLLHGIYDEDGRQQPDSHARHCRRQLMTADRISINNVLRVTCLLKYSVHLYCQNIQEMQIFTA